ncbi:aspartate aminotransferase family protein [Clostridium brassicae]|uniref:Aspartate aminotransferase family protein n=1 Tax=Clostridium brassicae TaxID=2999072 RepID=A0ABT4D5Q5_9CLOT|nr:aspartate aminotransferase family protein [Clostridium brassicae]MCY6957518.1 aspartate aminotransferase family protein [Clostridium brassicae]
MRFISIEEANDLDEKIINKMYKKNYNPGLYKLFKLSDMNKNFVRASGIHVYDDEGNEYIDFLSGFGALNLGHNNGEVIETIQKVSSRPNMLQVSKNKYASVLANNISYLTKGELKYSIFTNSGTETVEEALKLALFYKKGGNIVYFSKAYHGKTLGSLSTLGNKIKHKYKSTLPNFIEVPYGNIDKFKEVVNNYDISGVIIEPIQGEGGIIVSKNSFLKELRAICDKKDIVLIFDEIQTGLGRCGSMFCYERFGVVPDIMCLAKSLSGGIIPIGCVAVEEILWEDTYGKIKNARLPSSTFGGNTFACAAAIKTLSIIEDNKLYKRAEVLGNYTISKLLELRRKHKIIKDVRGMGLMIGIEIGQFNQIIPTKIIEVAMANIISKLMNEYGIISGFTINCPSVLRIQPPLIVDKVQIDYLLYALDRIFEEESDIFKLGLDSTKNIFKNVL